MLGDAAAGAPPSVTMVVTGQMAPSNETPEPGRKPRSAGELRRRRWADARKKGRLLGEQLGIEVKCVDCARTQGDELAKEVGDAHCLWVTGGNTFFLWQHMRASGLDALIRRRLAAGALYVGCSAGAIVAGQSVSTALWKGWDDPGAAAETDWSDPANLQGLALVQDCSFFPHYDAEWAALVERERGALGHTVVCLEDLGEAYPPDAAAAGAAPTEAADAA